MTLDGGETGIYQILDYHVLMNGQNEERENPVKQSKLGSFHTSFEEGYNPLIYYFCQVNKITHGFLNRFHVKIFVVRGTLKNDDSLKNYH